MHNKFITLTPELYEYVVEHSSRRDPVFDALKAETEEKLGPVSMMQIAAEQGAFMTMLTRLIGARSAIEIGTFTGYSALAVAKGLPDDGKLICCDISEEWTALGRRAWERAGVAKKIDLRLAPALDTLRSLAKTEQFDMAFIDADKGNYDAYFEELLPRMRRNAVILFDNVLWSGTVADASNTSDDTVALRALNDKLAKDERVEVVMLPIADGLTLVRKK